MKNLTKLCVIGLLASNVSHAQIKVSEIQTIELKDRELLQQNDLKKLKIENRDGSLNLRKIPNFSNIELKDGLNLDRDTILSGGFQRSAEGGQDGGGG